MKPCYRQRRFSHIDACDGGATVRQCLAEQSATAAYIQYVFAFHVGVLVNPASAQWIDVVEWFEFTVGVPPAGCQRLKLGYLCGIDVGSS